MREGAPLAVAGYRRNLDKTGRQGPSTEIWRSQTTCLEWFGGLVPSYLGTQTLSRHGWCSL